VTQKDIPKTHGFCWPNQNPKLTQYSGREKWIVGVLLTRTKIPARF